MRCPSRTLSATFTLALLALACTEADITPIVNSMGGNGGTSSSNGGTDGGTEDAMPDVAVEPDAAPDVAIDSAIADVAAVDMRLAPDAMPTEGIRPSMTGQLVITELLADADAAADDFGEWFEVYNPSATQTYDLFDCYLGDIGGSIHQIKAHVLIAPGQVATFGLFATAAEGGFVPHYTYSGVKFSNDSDDGVRITCGAALIDEARYQAGAIVSGRAFSLDPMHFSASDNDVATNWCIADQAYNAKAGAVDYGTPGRVNPPCP